MIEKHDVTIVYLPEWNEHIPECSCGWTGSFYGRRTLAAREAKRHQAKGVR